MQLSDLGVGGGGRLESFVYIFNQKDDIDVLNFSS